MNVPTSFTRRLTSENKLREETDFTESMEKPKETSITKKKELGGYIKLVSHVYICISF